MTRISLKEAYDNRDVIAQLVSLRDDVDELLNILKDIDPDGDLTNVVTKTGDQTIDGVKTFIGKIVANCDIIQNGSAYETHAEQLYTTKDDIVTRDGALGGLQPGEFSGFRVNKYDSVHDGHLVMDMNGVARVGDVNDEQPLATRDETADMTSGALVKWDGVNQKLIAPSSNAGSDIKPIKIVSGVPTPVSDDLIPKKDLYFKQGDVYTTGSSFVYYGFVDNTTRLYVDIKLPKLLDRSFTISVTAMDVCGVDGSFTNASNPIASVATNNQTPDTIRLGVVFTNPHGLATRKPVSGFISYTLTVL